MALLPVQAGCTCANLEPGDGDDGDDGDPGPVAGIPSEGAQRPCHVGVYVLANRDNRGTYVGCAWTSFHHRLRQHNREIKGGARATAGSRTWHHRLLVTGFASHKNALSFEWYVKRYRVDRSARARASVRDPVARRRLQIERLLAEFGTTRFPGLTLHAFEPGGAGCVCFACCNQGRAPGQAGQKARFIVPFTLVRAKPGARTEVAADPTTSS
jgi:predicted GIY-YIG superfamily endonuclease